MGLAARLRAPCKAAENRSLCPVIEQFPQSLERPQAFSEIPIYSVGVTLIGNFVYISLEAVGMKAVCRQWSTPSGMTAALFQDLGKDDG